MSESRFPTIPPNMPRLPPSRVLAPIARWLFTACGWRIAGQLPDVPKVIAIVAPHSSNWDVLWGLFFKVALRLDIRFVAKREVFFWPLGPILRFFGGIAVDRSAAHGVVGEMKNLYDSHDKMWIAITPEGTRKRVEHWKSGFWRIAREANVPILPAYFHYPEKTIGLGPLFIPTDDLDADLKKIRQFYEPWQGKNRGTT